MECLIQNPTDGTILVLIPAGVFNFGGAAAHKDGPTFQVNIPAFYMAIHAVTNNQYKKFVEATGHRTPNHADFGQPLWKENKFPLDKAYHPATCVSHADALAYCKWAGLRLANEFEWEKAAGVNQTIYPWGNQMDFARCRNGKDRGQGTTTEVWAYPHGCNKLGLYQMAGNVWEWCANFYQDDVAAMFKSGRLRMPGSGATIAIRGGSWDNEDEETFRCSKRFDVQPDSRFDNLGFRCAKDLN